MCSTFLRRKRTPTPEISKYLLSKYEKKSYLLIFRLINDIHGIVLIITDVHGIVLVITDVHGTRKNHLNDTVH